MLFFNRSVTWEENLTIICWASYMVRREKGGKKSMRWVIMQGLKECSTLRISKKFNKPRPRIIYKEGSQNNEIKNLQNIGTNLGNFNNVLANFLEFGDIF